jgi:hypothetical protein
MKYWERQGRVEKVLEKLMALKTGRGKACEDCQRQICLGSAILYLSSFASYIIL